MSRLDILYVRDATYAIGSFEVVRDMKFNHAAPSCSNPDRTKAPLAITMVLESDVGGSMRSSEYVKFEALTAAFKFDGASWRPGQGQVCDYVKAFLDAKTGSNIRMINSVAS